MTFKLNDQVIRSLCGRFSYEAGEVIYQTGKVTFTREDPQTSFYEATIDGEFQVSVDHSREELSVNCSCHLFHPDDKYCEHIAAVLLNINDSIGGSPLGLQSKPIQTPAEDLQLITRMQGLFNDHTLRPSRTFFDTRTILQVEFTYRPFHLSDQKVMFGIEIKAGPKQLYSVPKIREFLDRINSGQAYSLSKHFTYDPEIHSFQKENHAVIQQLIQIYQNEKLYSETSHIYSDDAISIIGDRMLLIPPFSWETLLSLLAKAPSVRLEQGDHSFDGIRLSDEPIPLNFEFDQVHTAGYQMDIKGLDRITVMESYGVVLFEGKLLKLKVNQSKLLLEIKQMLETYRKNQIQIPTEQLESFMENVVPGLMKLGSVRIGQAISDRIVQTPLKARLYLDRVRDRLLAGLEFQYGDIVINPLEGFGEKRSTHRILMRDGDQERRILELMEQSCSAKTEGGYIIDEEDAEYDFLYHIIPQLEKLLKVYATSAVKARLHRGHSSPQVRIDMDERTNWLEFQFDMGGIPDTEIRNLLQDLEEKRKYYRLPNGALAPLETAEFQEIIRLINDLGIRVEDVQGTKIRLPLVRGLHFIDSSEQRNAIRLGKSFRGLLENIRNPDNLDFPVPDSLAPLLRDYQKFGFQWLKTLAHYRLGGILADDMGLGKTLQSIAFVVSELPEIRHRKLRALIVCPATLMYNWRNELKKFAPEIRAVIADGRKQERSNVLKSGSQFDVIITSYPLLRRDIKLYAEQSFHTLILDEAQAFKNHATQTAQAVKEIQAMYRFALTGTPVENTLEELWSIFQVVFPELFQSRKAFNELSREVVAKRVRPFVLRRLKSDVLKELPEKIETLQASELLPDQKKLYVAYLAKLKQETVKHLNEGNFQKNRIKILAGLTRLRQLCCHPALFVEGYTGSSAKFEQLLDIVEECRREGKRMLIFSQFTEMLGLIGRELGFVGVPYFYLDGNTRASERVELCNRFNEGEKDLFLISLKAGGTGLNLTGADTVILYDLWWNPAIEQQAADRAYRIGQKNVVQVIRLVTQGTVEDKMYELQQKKMNLIDEVIQPGQEDMAVLSEDDIRELLTI